MYMLQQHTIFPEYMQQRNTLPLVTMQDFIPPEELAKLAAKSGDKASAEALEKQNAIGAWPNL